jgi:hypothetical protein
LNQDAYEALGRPEAVEMLFDRDEQVMGLRAAPKLTTPHAYAVRAQKNSSSLLVSGRAFNQHYGLTADTTRRYPATMIDDVLAIDLKGGAAVRRQGRSDAGRGQ